MNWLRSWDGFAGRGALRGVGCWGGEWAFSAIVSWTCRQIYPNPVDKIQMEVFNRINSILAHIAGGVPNLYKQ